MWNMRRVTSIEYKIEISKDSVEKGEKKGRVRKKYGKNKNKNMFIFMPKGIRLRMFIFLTCL